MKIVFTALLGFSLLSANLSAQVKIGDNVNTVNTNALLELESTNKALLLPRLNQTQIDAMQNVPAGMLVYNSTTNVLNIRTNTGWITLAQAANAASVTNPWSTTGLDIYSNNVGGKVGIGTSTPFSKLANTAGNTIGSDGLGGNPDSFAWSASQAGYAAQINNSLAGNAGNGLAVKVAAPGSVALDVSRGDQTTVGTSLLYVKSNGRVGINTNSPSEALEVNGNIKYSGNLQMGVQYVYKDLTYPANNLGNQVAGCPSGTKLIGGGGGQLAYDANGFNISVIYSGPDASNNNQWRITVKNTNSTAVVMRVYAICAKVQ
ncbi:hypothetical protein [Spirosoma koreense]